MSSSVIRRSGTPHRSSNTPRFSAITFSTVSGRLRGRGCRSGSLGMSLRRRTKEAGRPAATSPVAVIPRACTSLKSRKIRRVSLSRESAVISAARTWCASRLANATMSSRPSATGWCPPSSRDMRKLSDNTSAARMVSRAESAGDRPRRRGRSSAAHHLTASRSHRWLMPVKSSLPGSPNTLSCQTSLARSFSGPDSRQYNSDVSHRSNWRASGRISAPGTWARSSTLPACRACSSLTRQRVEVGRVRSPASVRRCSPASSSATTRSGRPRRTTSCPATSAGAACRAHSARIAPP